MGWAVAAGALISGVATWLGNRSAEKQAKKDQKNRLKAIGVQGDETRRTALYEAMLADHYSQKNKYRKYAGALNYVGAANAVGPSRYATLNSMRNYQSKNVPTDPGAVPQPATVAPGVQPNSALGAALQRRG